MSEPEPSRAAGRRSGGNNSRGQHMYPGSGFSATKVCQAIRYESFWYLAARRNLLKGRRSGARFYDVGVFAGVFAWPDRLVMEHGDT
jgi:hypothetical protein